MGMGVGMTVYQLTKASVAETSELRSSVWACKLVHVLWYGGEVESEV